MPQYRKTSRLKIRDDDCQNREPREQTKSLYSSPCPNQTCARLSEPTGSITSYCSGKEPARAFLPHQPPLRRGRTGRYIACTRKSRPNRAYRTNVMPFPTALVGFIILLVSGTSFRSGALFILRTTYVVLSSLNCLT